MFFIRKKELRFFLISKSQKQIYKNNCPFYDMEGINADAFHFR